MSPLPVRADSDATPRRRFVENVLPPLTSVMVHVGLIVLGIATYQAVVINLTPTSKPPAVIPEALADLPSDDNFTKLFPGPTDDDPLRQFMRDDVKIMDDAAKAFGKAPSLNVTTMLDPGGAGADSAAEDAIAVGPKLAFGRDGQHVGIGPGVTGTAAGDNGLARIGPPGGGTNDVFLFPKGPKSVANKVVFLCDSSGSMLPTFDALRQELRKAVDRLRPGQQFDIVFFSADRYVALDDRLLYALPENKRRAHQFLEAVTPHSSSDPIPGLRAAFATQPELIFVLTDGDFPDNDRVLAELQKLSKDGRVKINTIAFVTPGDAYEKVLKKIAQEHGGMFKFIAEQDLEP